MSTYFFDVVDGERVYTDQVGASFVDDHAARLEVIDILRELARDELTCAARSFVTTARDASGRTRFRATLTLTLEPSLQDLQ